MTKPLYRTFLICPVRGKDPQQFADIVSRLEAGGYIVHWPPRDTNQVDDTGIRICRDNAEAIRVADNVHIVWDGKSQGCLFDIGVAFALGKSIIPIDLPEYTDGKSFQNMIREWASRGIHDDLLAAHPSLSAKSSTSGSK